ncbi:Cell division protein SepF [Tessaracoccus sp. O5.2]|nr:Cell division protein SepF [Tessaracoccus lapidicaptus]
MGVRKLAAWMGLVEDGRYRDDEHQDVDDLTDDFEVYEEREEMNPVAPLPTRRPTPVTPLPQKEVADLSRIISVRPRSYNEARVIGENFRDGIPVIMNLSDMEDGEDKRLVDFAAGLIFGLKGNIERVSSKVFLLCPQNLVVGPEDKERIASGGFFNQS